jgi:hypothetical protein
MWTRISLAPFSRHHYRLSFTCFIYILANYYLLPLDTFNPLFTANRWDWQPHCKLGQSTRLCCVQVLRCCWCKATPWWGAIYKLSGAVAKLTSINLRKLVLSPTGSINLGFILREDLLLCLSYLPLGIPNWADIYTPSVGDQGGGDEACAVTDMVAMVHF